MSNKEELQDQLSAISKEQHALAFNALEHALENGDFDAALNAQNQLFHIYNNIDRMRVAIDRHFEEEIP